MKQMILGTRLGRLAMSVRDACSMLGTAYSSPEKLGTLANDHIASLLVTRLCQGGKIFIDIGAHIGSIISDVMHYCPGAEIIGVEPIPEKVAHLRRKFPNVKFMECALGESAGEATFYVNTRRSGFSTLGRPRDSFASQYVETRVPIKKLDNLVASDAVDVIKVDVEGAELGVLRGGEGLIARSRPTIMFESAPQTDDGLGFTKEELWSWFAERDYAVLVPNRVAHQDAGLTQSGFLESHLYPRRTTNYFAVPNERRIEVRDRARAVFKIEAT